MNKLFKKIINTICKKSYNINDTRLINNIKNDKSFVSIKINFSHEFPSNINIKSDNNYIRNVLKHEVIEKLINEININNVSLVSEYNYNDRLVVSGSINIIIINDGEYSKN